MKKSLLVISLFVFPLIIFSQEEEKIDSVAVFILDKMSNVIGDLESVSFSQHTSLDVLNEFNISETHSGTSTVSMVGPDKLIAQISGDLGNKGYWYNGEFITYYSFDENNYVTLEAPDNIIEMIDSMHVAYDFKFPAADFFYPSFTDDILEHFTTIKYLGKKNVNGESCYHILAANNTTNVQLWVSSKMQNLPKKIIIIEKDGRNPRYEATFSDWILNPIIPDSMFEFTPPPKSKLISILAKS